MKERGKQMMQKYLINSLFNSEYAEIITILDYEIRVNSYLSQLVFPDPAKGKKAIVDLALKSGIDKYRFVSFDIDENGKIVRGSNRYVALSEEMELCANGFLREQKEIVMNSFLSKEQKNMLLR